MNEPRASSSARARAALPLALAAFGAFLLAGCLYVPATQQFQSNGRLRPEWIVGDEKSSKDLRTGRTTFADALPKLVEQILGEPRTHFPIERDGRFAFDPDSRQLAASYGVREGTTIGICGVNKQTNPRTIVLSFDEDGVLRNTKTLEGGSRITPAFAPLTYEAVEQAFGPAVAKDLQARGTLFDDATREKIKAAQAEAAARRQTPGTTSPATRWWMPPP